MTRRRATDIRTAPAAQPCLRFGATLASVWSGDSATLPQLPVWRVWVYELGM